MKCSGVEWIGEIPDNWDVRKVKQCFYISKEQAHEENPTILSLARAGVKVRDISNNEGQLAASYDNYNPVMPGDLLLNPMDLYSGANCSLSEVSGVISPAYINLKKKVELNPKFYDLWMPLVEHKEEIAHYNTVKNVTATSGMSKEKLKALCLDRPSQHDEIVQYGWAKKQLHHCIRLREFIERYINGEPFADCLISKDTGYLVDIKAFGHKFYTLDEAVSLAAKMDTETYALKEEYIKTHEEVIDEKMEQLMLDTTVNILKKTLKEDILK